MVPTSRHSSVFRNEHGAFDLPSVLIGVAVVAILAVGVMALIFGAVPWAQNRAAAQDLAALTTAQGTAKTKDGTYADRTLMSQLGYLSGSVDIAVAADGSCWVGVTQAKSGKHFYTVNGSAPAELTRDTRPGCLDGIKYDKIAVGSGGGCAVSNKSLYCWGGNKSGEVGDGTKDTAVRPVRVGGALTGKDVADIYAGVNHRCATDTGGILYCWGSNMSGEVGDGTRNLRYSPVAVGGPLAGKKVSAVGFTSATTCAVSEQKLYCWGDGVGISEATLGNAAQTAQSNLPVLVNGGALAGVAVKSVDLGASHACALSVGGSAYCWGYGIDGQVGNGSGATSNPLPVAANMGRVAGGRLDQLASGGNTNCGVGGGKLYCWGFGRQGQTGSGELYAITRPSPIEGSALDSKNLIRITAGNGQACAGDDGGGWTCWGMNAEGNLGTGRTDAVLYPAAFTSPGTGPWPQELSVGTYISCALNAGTAYCAGQNTLAGLGDGTAADSSTFVRVLEPAGRKTWVDAVLDDGKLP